MRTEEQKSLTILKLLEWSTEHFSARGFEEARLNSELLLAHVLEVRRIDLYMKHEMLLAPGDVAKFKSCFNRRLSHEPVQYIVGWTEFMGLRFELNPSVLIPRPETEILVESVIAQSVKNPREGELSILDIGTGSGCIAISLARMVPGSRLVALDVSPEALSTARSNAMKLGVDQKVRFMRHDVMKEDGPPGKFDIIVSNPPYIPVADVETLQPEIRIFEPRAAFTDFGDGLSFFRRISMLGTGLLRPEGALAVEVGYDQADFVREIFLGDGYSEIEMIKDYGGIPRVVMGRRRG